ncbi:MAG: hypothetical protein P1P85_04245 [Patescibacteria group bacterium]|nr:hypothetical protein [Patescibacteria group bacterium]
MKFPATNKIHQEKFGDNAKLLEELCDRKDFKKIIKSYFILLGVFLITLFSTIITVRLALNI